MSKLVNLRILDIECCYGLTCMPRGMDKFTALHTLTNFVVNDELSSSWKQELKDLTKLKNRLQINIFSNKITNVKEYGSREGGSLSTKEHLNCVEFEFCEEEGDRKGHSDEALVEELQPHCNIKELGMKGYRGIRMPGWARGDNLATYYPNLVAIEIDKCPKLQYLTCLGNLLHLKNLDLKKLLSLEYIGNGQTENSIRHTRAASTQAQGSSFFPSLEGLFLWELPKLKGWCVEDNDQLDISSSSSSMPQFLFSQLKSMVIFDCQELTAILQCPVVEYLSVSNSNKRLQIIERVINDTETGDENGESSSIFSFNFPKLRHLGLDMVTRLPSLPKKSFHSVKILEIDSDKEIESLDEVGELFRNCLSSLQELKIGKCPKLKSVCGGLVHLTALESLKIDDSPDLSLSEEGKIVSVVTWRSLQHSLRHLELVNLPVLVVLPSWIQYLTALQTLEIKLCYRLESFPDWMPKLTSLTRLSVEYCSAQLKQRCQRSTGMDWPHIQHIPSIEISL
ncbi:hypothetical protein SOVF_067170 [Spinacia oleracea]|nr:hypothetical protein SOVF_067170 [Spinacia oleracea]